MYHSITFGDGSLYPSGHEKEGQFKGTNTWDDWHLIPAERPSIASPGVSTNFVEIPGRDGAIDFSTFLVNKPVYGMRQGSWDFYVDNDHEYWETIRMKIMNFLHGKRMKIVLEDDPDWYWEGRFAVDSWRSEASNSRISINYQLDPYKKRVKESGVNDIIWDTFSFEKDYDYYASLNSIVVNGDTYSAEIECDEYAFKVYATVAVEAGNEVAVSLNGTATTISTSGTVLLGKAHSGTNTVTVSGTGTVTVHFTGGSL